MKIYIAYPKDLCEETICGGGVVVVVVVRVVVVVVRVVSVNQ